MEEFTVKEFQNNFNTLLNRVENGESFVIKSEYGNAIIVPYDQSINPSDEIIKIYTDHGEGS
jgi:antitoxin (DNA-binding transcriptional repressor) of toxin-antitoxin stability system